MAATKPPSSSGLGLRPFTPATPVRTRLGVWPPLTTAALERPNNAHTSSFVYFFLDPELRRVKIGKARDPKARLKELQTGHSAPLEFVGCLAGDQALERELHNEFADSHVRGEWFKITDRLTALVLDACIAGKRDAELGWDTYEDRFSKTASDRLTKAHKQQIDEFAQVMGSVADSPCGARGCVRFAIPILAGLLTFGFLHPAYTPSQTARGSALRAHAARTSNRTDGAGDEKRVKWLSSPATRPTGMDSGSSPRSVSARFLVTSYCLHGRTATGTYTRPGTIAVDPRVVPLRSLMSVPGYGRGQALDTGGAIRNHRLDVWYSSCRDAFAWGARWKTVRWG